jgi:hypothetical protein
VGVREDFEAVTAEIEKYLGILKGNETAWEWRETYKEDNFSHYGAPYSPVPPQFQTSPPGGEYTVFFEQLLLPDEAFGEGQDKVAFGRQINERLETSFTNGFNWSKGIADYLNDLCADLIRPDAGDLKLSVQAFRDSMVEVEASLPAQWTDLDFNSWIGESSDDCQTVVTQLHSIVRDQYLTYYAHSFAVYGGACALATAAQEGLVKAMEDIRDGIKDNLQAWQNLGAPPFDVGPIDPKVVSLGSIATTITGKIPGVGTIQSAVFDFAGLGSEILGLFGVDTGELLSYTLDAKDADTVYTDMTTMLQDAYLTPLQTGMDQLRAEKSQKLASEQNGIDPWFPPTLEGADDERWRHDQEDE